MEQFTIKDLRKLSPCYDPTKYLPEDWQGTVLDILNVTECPAKDRLWVVLHKEFMTDKQLRLFAVWCARQSLAIPGNESEVCSNTCDVAERYANGEATDEELAAAWYAAWYAGTKTATGVIDAGLVTDEAAIAGNSIGAAVDLGSSSVYESLGTRLLATKDFTSTLITSYAQSLTLRTGLQIEILRSAAKDAAWSAQINHLKIMLA